MKNFVKNKRSIISILVLLMTAVVFTVCNKGASKDKTPWIWQIEGKKYSVSDFEDAHEAFVFLMAQQLNRTPEQLQPLIENPEMAGDPRLAKLLEGLKKENFPEIYKRILLINHDADKKGFLKNERVKKRVQFLEQYFVTSLYLDDKINISDVPVDETEAIEFVERIRKSDPRYIQVPMDQLLAEAKNQIRFQKLGQKREEYVSQIRDSYKIETNDNFDLKKHLAEGSGNKEPVEQNKEKTSEPASK